MNLGEKNIPSHFQAKEIAVGLFSLAQLYNKIISRHEVSISRRNWDLLFNSSILSNLQFTESSSAHHSFKVESKIDLITWLLSTEASNHFCSAIQGIR